MSAGITSSLRQSVRSVKSDSSSLGDKSTPKPTSKPVSLPRRLLFPALPADTDLPPLLVSPGATPFLNEELYEFIALALRAYVNPWWTKITRYDKEFLPEITRILTAVVRSLETRLVATDLPSLIFRGLPTLLVQHYADFRSTKAKLHTSYATGGAATLPQLFHHLQPHMAITADGNIDDVYVRQAVDHILKVCLPPEDYDSEAERYIVREIILSVLLRSVIPRVTQPWFIHKIILDQLGPERGLVANAESPGSASDALGNANTARPPFSLQALAIFFLSAIQSMSGICLFLIHTYRQARDTIKKVNESAPLHSHAPSPSGGPSIAMPAPASCPAVPGVSGSVTSTHRKYPSQPIALTIPTPPTPTSISSTNPLLRTTSASTVQTSTNSTNSILVTPPSVPATPLPSTPPPSHNYVAPLLALFQAFLPSTLTARALIQTLALPLTAFEPFLSRLLPYLLYNNALSPERIADMVRSARRALFPDGWPPPPPPDPTPEEQAVMRAALVRRLLAAVPVPLAMVLGSTPEARSNAMDAILDPLSFQACNAHFMLLILDLVIVTVFPELGVTEAVPGAATESASAKAA